MPLLARAHRDAGARELELQVLERYVSGYTMLPAFWDALFLGPAHERLAKLYDERGESASAAKHYAEFIELWKNADETLGPRVDAARARLALEQILAESS